MRKIFAILILGIVIVTTACADNDVITRNLIYHLRRTACQWYGSLLRQQRRLDGSRRQKV